MLIETVRIRAGRAPLWDHHAGRFLASARALGLADPPLDPPTWPGDGALRLTWDGHALRADPRPIGGPEPVRLIVAAAVHERYPHKTTRRQAFDTALAEACAAGADDAVLLTPDGFVAETSIRGIYWWEGVTLAAPPEALGILPSVARRRIAEIAGPITERRAVPAHLAAHSPFVANAARGIAPVASLDGIPLRADESAMRRTAALAAAFWP